MDSINLALVRAELHLTPEYSHKENLTADTILRYIRATEPDELYTGIGGHGIVAGYRGVWPGDSLMFRCEMDAVPTEHGPDHLCGHDGHMAILIGVANVISKARDYPGKVWLFFQPAEEIGEGAARMVVDISKHRISFDYSFALHNNPRHELNKVIMYSDVYAAASVGMELLFSGSPSHAAFPEQAANPTYAIINIVEEIKRMNSDKRLFHNFVLGTVVNVHIGEANYGVTPGSGIIRVTLRAYDENDLNLFCRKIESFAGEKASASGLKVDITYHDRFPSTRNNVLASNMVLEAAQKLGIPVEWAQAPSRGSEDFAHFTSISKACFFDIGNGKESDDIHREGYRFSDEILEPAVRLYSSIIYNRQSK